MASSEQYLIQAREPLVAERDGLQARINALDQERRVLQSRLQSVTSILEAIEILQKFPEPAPRPADTKAAILRVMEAGLPGQAWSARELMDEITRRGWFTSKGQEPVETVRWAATTLAEDGQLRKQDGRFIWVNPFPANSTDADMAQLRLEANHHRSKLRPRRPLAAKQE